ncbi:MAG: hypothetical protein ACOYO1_14010 [Bacteroidales bacterium]
MKKLNINLSLKKMITPLVPLFFFFALHFNANAQVLTGNYLTAPAVVTSTVAFNPGIIIGSAVTVKDAQGSTCPAVTYEWQSATNEYFTENLTKNLAATKDYNPGVVTATTFFRRVVSIQCTDPERESLGKCGGVKITIN